MSGVLSLTETPLLSREESEALGRRILSFASAGTFLQVNIASYSRGYLRWANNRRTASGELSNARVDIAIAYQERKGSVVTNKLDDVSLKATIAEAEQMALAGAGNGENLSDLPGPQTYPNPQIWSETSLGLDETARTKLGERLVRRFEAAGVRSAGYIETGVMGSSVTNTHGLFAYSRATTAQYSATARAPDGSASGWAGVSDYDWARIDADALSERALQKCKASANPSALEPGRYTLIMEPQAVAQMIEQIVELLSLGGAQTGTSPFYDPKSPDHTKLGQKVLDGRITLSADPMDADGGFVPFNGEGFPHRKITWVDRGTLTNLSNDGYDAIPKLNSKAIRMSGGETSLEEMIATTRRGLLVTRFNSVSVLNQRSLLCTGNTRDGLWLVENGKIKQPIKNFRFHESPMFIFNNLEQLGKPVRVLHADPFPGAPQSRFIPWRPMIIPPAKVRDFNFTSLSDAV